jgi:PKD repeat protein
MNRYIIALLIPIVMAALTVTTTSRAAPEAIITVISTATATDPAGNTSEFSAYSNPIGYAPISGLQAFNDTPTYLGASTHFTTTVTGGSSISFAWNFGDGFTGSGATIAHSYNSIGTYTASVTATNSGSSASASVAASTALCQSRLHAAHTAGR